MADYTTLAAVKAAMRPNSTDATDDTFIGTLITRASRHIDEFCNRVIVAAAETRKFHAHDDVDGDDLLLDKDLVSVTTLTNGDGDVLAASTYVLLPTNFSPKHIIRLKSDSSKSWTWTSDPNEAISVNGSWGYSTGTPSDIQQATNRIVIWWYKMRENPFLEVATQEGGLASVAPGMPNDIRELLRPYVRRAIT